MKKLTLFIGLFILTYIFYSAYLEMTKPTKSATAKRVACQAQTTTFENVYKKELINDAIMALENGEYNVKSHMEYSKYMQSHLVNILSLEQANETLQEILNTIHPPLNSLNAPLLIDYYVYENDKDDPKKKNKSGKKYAGYVHFEFKYNNQLIYKIQTDYMDIDAKDLSQRMQCAIDSFLSLKP
jgi:hypothetical protein